MSCPRCQGHLVVEPLPVELVAIVHYSKRFGWLRCVNCGMCLDLTMLRTKQERALARQVKEALASVSPTPVEAHQ